MQINWQKSRYVYNMYYVHNRISREVYDYCIKNKLVDSALIAKWKKPGYEKLCSTYVINPSNYKFGTVSICRVPRHCLAEGASIEDPVTGCRGCASGSGESNIFGNKYGQDLAAIQIAREERMFKLKEEQDQKVHDSDENDVDDDDVASDDDEEEEGPVISADGSSKPKMASIWEENRDKKRAASSDDDDDDETSSDNHKQDELAHKKGRR